MDSDVFIVHCKKILYIVKLPFLTNFSLWFSGEWENAIKILHNSNKP